jgi:hypothetical protein
LTAPLSCPATHYLPLQLPKLSHALETCNRFLSAGVESADKRLQHIVIGLRTLADHAIARRIWASEKYRRAARRFPSTTRQLCTALCKIGEIEGFAMSVAHRNKHDSRSGTMNWKVWLSVSATAAAMGATQKLDFYGASIRTH